MKELYFRPESIANTRVQNFICCSGQERRYFQVFRRQLDSEDDDAGLWEEKWTACGVARRDGCPVLQMCV